MADIFIKEAARRIFAVEGQAKGYRKKSAWEARAGEEPNNAAEPPRRGNLLKSPWISPGTGLFDCPWGTGGRAGIWTLDGLVQHGQVHLLPADPRRSFGFFSPAEKRNPPAGGTPLSCKKAWQRTSCETAFRLAPPGTEFGSNPKHERQLCHAGAQCEPLHTPSQRQFPTPNKKNPEPVKRTPDFFRLDAITGWREQQWRPRGTP